MHRSACGEDCEETLTFHDYLPAKATTRKPLQPGDGDWNTVLAIMPLGNITNDRNDIPR